jgi:hypothetical protein
VRCGVWARRLPDSARSEPLKPRPPLDNFCGDNFCNRQEVAGEDNVVAHHDADGAAEALERFVLAAALRRP